LHVARGGGGLLLHGQEFLPVFRRLQTVTPNYALINQY